ncbi:MAG: transcription termination/antitermination protein NusA [Acholeplasmataceae bacterium]|nr:transcription termination/antitermination protein NusA [Acholeplasmataceae bacterium]
MNADFVQAIFELGKEKGISPELLYQAVEEALITAYKKNFGSSQNVRVDLNKQTGEIHVYARKNIVEHVNDALQELSIEEARKLNPNYELDDIIELEVTPKNFGRIAAQNAKQVVVQRIREAERGMVFEKFSSRENDIVNGVVQRLENRNVYIDLGRAEAILMPNEQIPGEVYQLHDRIKTYIVEVKKTNKGPQIMVSRTHPGLLKRLFELEVPEIHDGLVEIKSVAREAGMRSKIAVYTKDENIDPVGACVGQKGMRVQTIVNELRGEKIDIVKYSSNPEQYVANALSPAKVILAEADDNEKICRVVVPDYQLSLAIGKEGQNARLAAKLTGWKIDIKSESQAQPAVSLASNGNSEESDEYED